MAPQSNNDQQLPGAAQLLLVHHCTLDTRRLPQDQVRYPLDQVWDL